MNGNMLISQKRINKINPPLCCSVCEGFNLFSICSLPWVMWLYWILLLILFLFSFLLLFYFFCTFTRASRISKSWKEREFVDSAYFAKRSSCRCALTSNRHGRLVGTTQVEGIRLRQNMCLRETCVFASLFANECTPRLLLLRRFIVFYYFFLSICSAIRAL